MYLWVEGSENDGDGCSSTSVLEDNTGAQVANAGERWVSLLDMVGLWDVQTIKENEWKRQLVY